MKSIELLAIKGAPVPRRHIRDLKDDRETRNRVNGLLGMVEFTGGAEVASMGIGVSN